MPRLGPLLFLLLGACADDPAPGALGPCDTSAGPLLGCAGPNVGSPPPTIEQACARLVDCGRFLVNNVDPDGNHHDDFATCVDGLRSDEYTADRLEFVLRCIDVSSCDQLLQDHCGAFGGEAPQ